MTLPVGVKTFVLTCGPYTDFAGTPLSGKVTVFPRRNIVWTATGAPLVTSSVTVTLDAAGNGQFPEMPSDDQSGFSDGVGNQITNWGYIAILNLEGRQGETRTFHAPTGVATGVSLDLDLITAASAGDVAATVLPLVTSVNGQTGAVVISGIGGSGVPNDASVTDVKVATAAGISLDKTADSATRIAMTAAQVTQLAGAAPTASPAFTGTPTGITAAHVGLGSVDNTSDVSKPISTAQAAVNATKAPLASPAFTGTPTGITATHVGLGNVTNTSDANKPVSTAQQTALNLKAPLASPAFTGTPTGITATHVGLGNVNNTSDAAKPISTAQAAVNAVKADLVGGLVPASQLPSLVINHTFTVASQAAMLALSTAVIGDAAIRTDVSKTFVLTATPYSTLANWVELVATGNVLSVAGRQGTVVLTSTDVGLANVDNTSDVNKPVSTATTTQLNLKAPLASPAFTGTPTGITATHVGLGNVDNTSDVNKPVSTATQTALNLLAPLASPAFTGTPTGLTKTHVGLANVDNTSDVNKPLSTADIAALALKATIASPAFTGTVTGITKSMVGLANVDNTSDVNKPISAAQATVNTLKADLVSSLVPVAQIPSLPVSKITALTEEIQDQVAAALVAGTGMTITYDDTAGTITLASSAAATAATMGVRVKSGSTWPARPTGYATVMSIGADPSPLDQLAGDLRAIPAS